MAQTRTDAAPSSSGRDGDAPAIRAHGLGKRYGATVALQGLELSIERGEVYGYLGPNGAGKTTTIRLMLGLHRPSEGGCELFGIDAWREPVRAHRHTAFVAGEPALWPALTGAETLQLLANLRGGDDEAYRRTLVDRFELDSSKRVRALSKGNRQKVQLIAAFASRADLLILDEPTAGLDPLMEVAFRSTVKEARERGQTVFLSSHILSEVEALCDRVGILRAGRLIDEGTLAEMRRLGEHVIEVTFEGPAPDLGAPAGARIQGAGASALLIHVTGPVGPVLTALAAQPVLSLTSREPSLEEIFLHHYEDPARDGRS